ncbi:MAG: hypothetical protein PHU53_01880 [Thermoplasmata archaeon]|nr:hypothetical protein [Thermoplasmata archaeon]
MEEMNENVNRIADKDARGYLSAAAESFLANLPILVCGTVMALTLFSEIIGG